MTSIIMIFDMLHIDSIRYARLLINIKEIIPEVRIIDYTTNITLKLPNINRIKTNESSK